MNVLRSGSEYGIFCIFISYSHARTSCVTATDSNVNQSDPIKSVGACGRLSVLYQFPRQYRLGGCISPTMGDA